MTERRRTIIFLNLLVVSIASSFLSTALSAALPPIISEFGVDASTGQWITSIYSLVMGITMPLTAFLITRFRTKRLYLSAILVMMVGLSTSAFATTFPVMMVGRVFQAFANGITTAMAQVVILSIYPPEKKGTIMGWYGLSLGAAPIVAPTIGGVLVDTVGWRMIFYFTLGFMAVGFLVTLFSFEDALENTRKKFDVYSFVLSAFAFGGITLAIGNIRRGFSDPLVYVSLLLGIVGTVLFVRRQLSQTSPFLDLTVFRSRNFTLAIISSLLFYLGMMGSTIITPLYAQSVLGSSAAVSGLVTLPGSLVMSLVSPYVGRLFDRYGMRRLAVFGSVALLLSYLGMVFVTLSTSLLVATGLHVVRCLGIACMMMPFITWGVTSVPKEKTAHANALVNALRQVGGAIGQALFVSIMTAVTAASVVSHGEKAGIHGVNIAYLCMAAISLVQLIISLLFIPEKD